MSVSILGGGISGLSSLHYLKKLNKGNNLNVTLFEKNRRVGGWIQTTSRKLNDDSSSPNSGYLLEMGPRSLRTATAKDTVELIEDLNLQNEIVFPADTSNKRCIYMNGNLMKVPSTISSELFSPLTRLLIFDVLKHCLKSHSVQNIQDESIKDFFTRYIGKKATESLIAPVFLGIYAGNIEKLSAKSTLPSLFENTLKKGNLIKALSMSSDDDISDSALFKKIRDNKINTITFKNGLETLTRTLEKQYRENIDLENEISAIHFPKNRKIVLEVSLIDAVHETDHVISCLPAYKLGKLIKPTHKTLGDLLESIEYVSVAVVSFVFEGDVIPDHAKSFGYLIPPKEKSPILGATFDSVVFPLQNRNKETRISVMIGGDLSNHDNVVDPLKTTHKELEAIALKTLKEQIGIRKDPIIAQVKVCEKSIPQYTVGHSARIKEIESILANEFPNLHIVGSSLYDVSINGCIRNAKKHVMKTFGN